VQASSFEAQTEQINLLEGGRQQRWKDALAAGGPIARQNLANRA